MMGMCCRVVGETETAPTPIEPKASGRRRLEISHFKFIAADVAVVPPENGRKRQKIEFFVPPSLPRECQNAVKKCLMNKGGSLAQDLESDAKSVGQSASPADSDRIRTEVAQEFPKFGMTSVCGRRRDMEDAVAVHRSFCRQIHQNSPDLHFFGVYDGHGCSHVAMKCKDRFHEIVRDELEGLEEASWKETMDRSFSRMDREVINLSSGVGVSSSHCRCELQTPQCEAVGSTAVVGLVTPDKLVVSNCGDSRAVLCRNGVAIPLSSDHKPDRPDELDRIKNSGGRVIYWDGARVLGVLAMSRAIGDNYLKPFVISEPEVTVTERRPEDECLILASDGLWDVVSNETACGVARMCLRSQKPPSPIRLPGSDAGAAAAGVAVDGSDRACSDASMLLTKLALARNSTDNVSVVVVDLRRGI